MKSHLGQYILCVLGYCLCLVIALFANGGGVLVLPESKRGPFGEEVIPLPFKRKRPVPGSPGATAIVWVFASVFAISACGLLQWVIGFFWPSGLVSCGRRCAKNVQDHVGHEEAALLEGSGVALGNEKSRRRVVISLRAVTRGDSPEFVKSVCLRNIEAVAKVCSSRNDGDLEHSGNTACCCNGYEWILELVTEKRIDLAKCFGDDKPSPMRVYEILVPHMYEPENGSKSKARNLHYANQERVSCLTDEDFIVHLDEETVVTASALEGIVDFVDAYPDRIGQGMTVFGRGSVGNRLLTMCDTTRFIDDYCSFRLWHSLGTGLRGMKGSNFVIRVGIERQVSFDVGGELSILEDCAFALLAAGKGVRFGHMQGIMEEQSPLTFHDFFRQRQRWISGLITVCMHCEIPIRRRILLIFTLISWLFAPLALIIFLVVACLFHIPCNPITVITRTLLTATPAWAAFWGAALNFSPKSSGLLWYLAHVIGNLVLLPLCTMLEGVAILNALCFPVHHFQVVRKQLSVMRIDDESSPLLAEPSPPKATPN